MTVPILQKPLTVETLTVAFAFVVWAKMTLKPNSEALIEAVHPIHLCVKENVQPFLWQSDAECKEYGWEIKMQKAEKWIIIIRQNWYLQKQPVMKNCKNY